MRVNIGSELNSLLAVAEDEKLPVQSGLAERRANQGDVGGIVLDEENASAAVTSGFFTPPGTVKKKAEPFPGAESTQIRPR